MAYDGPGVYRNHKGQNYYAIGLARHSESEEEFVLYMPLYRTQSGHQYTVRNREMFDEQVYRDGVLVPRFLKITHEGQKEVVHILQRGWPMCNFTNNVFVPPVDWPVGHTFVGVSEVYSDEGLNQVTCKQCLGRFNEQLSR